MMQQSLTLPFKSWCQTHQSYYHHWTASVIARSVLIMALHVFTTASCCCYLIINFCSEQDDLQIAFKISWNMRQCVDGLSVECNSHSVETTLRQTPLKISLILRSFTQQWYCEGIKQHFKTFNKWVVSTQQFGINNAYIIEFINFHFDFSPY